MAHVTTALGIGSPALSRTTARICSVRPTSTWESSERIWTRAGVWAQADTASSPTQLRNLRKDFLHGAEAVVARAIDVIEAAARRRVVNGLGPVDAQRRVDGRRDVFRIDGPIAVPARVGDGGSGGIARA